VSLSYLVAPLVIDVCDVEAWSGVGSSNGSVGPPLFPYGCTPYFISSNGTFFLSSALQGFVSKSTPKKCCNRPKNGCNSTFATILFWLKVVALVTVAIA
jgi:hypothetical protein